MLAGFVSRVALESLAFIAVARILGPAAFGEFSAAVAVVLFIGPFVSFGGYSLMVRHIRDDVTSSGRWLSNVLVLTFMATPIATSILLGARALLLPQLSVVLVLSVAAGHFIGYQTRMIVSGALVAHGLQRANAFTELAAGIVRGAAAAALILDHGGLLAWAALYAMSELGAGLLAYLLALKLFRAARPRLRQALSVVGEGLLYSIAQASRTAYNDLDKAMLPGLASLAAAGLYSVAYKFIDVAYLPVNAFTSTIYPRFFDLGNRGGRGAFRLARHAAIVTASYGAFASLALFALAPVVPIVFGQDYATSVSALRWLAIVPFIQGLYWPFGDALTGMGKQALRTQAQVLTLACNAALNLALIPHMGWRGAAVATGASEALLFVLFVVLAYVQARSPRPGSDSETELNT